MDVNPEYTPAASQCQISTAAFSSGMHVFASTSAIRNRKGTPGLPSVMSGLSFAEST
jgi:hypothetical protein